MTRAAALAAYLVAEHHTTVPAVIPPALAVALYWVTFYYPVSPEYLSAVGGWDLAVVCLVLTLLLADRANRASMYPLAARLPGRWVLLAAIVLAVLCVMAVVSVGFAGLAVATGRVALTVVEAGVVAVRWGATFLLVSAVGLHLSRLASRGVSHLAAALLLAAAVTAGSWRGLGGDVSEAVASVLTAVTAPVAALLGGRADGLDGPALAAVLGGAGLVFALAVLLFRRKDLLWPE